MTARSRQNSLFTPEELPPDPMPWELAAGADRLLAEIVINRPLDTVYHYLVPDRLREAIAPGRRVLVPFGKGDKRISGFCVGLTTEAPVARRLKALDSILDAEPLLTPQMLELTRWIAARYLCGWGQVLESVVPAGVKRQAGTRLVTCYRLGPGVRERLAEISLPQKQAAVLNVLASADGPLAIDEITEGADCGTGPITALRQKGLIQAVRQRTDTFAMPDVPIEPAPKLVLNAEQQRAVEQIVGIVRAGEHRTILLHGVTGSGKTEVYIRAIQEIVGYGRQAIVLVPEISLTPQTIRRFRSRFSSVAVLHSHLSDAERHWHWQQIARGAVQVVVGARSAVFAPTPNLGIIVIDEEHETSFKQDSTPRYHAREVARRRGELERIPLILGTATPTLESWLSATEGDDLLVSLPNRVEKLPLPPVVIVDVRNDPHLQQGASIGRALFTSMRNALDDGGQVILFLNVRGFSPILWCRACGGGVKCPHCDITLSWHKDRQAALCHFCEYQTHSPTNCPQCGQAGIQYLGIGTQRLEEEVRARFPGHRCLRMDSDSMRKPGSHDVALEAFRHGEVKILLGTQMIAKGLDFPNVTLVGVIAADTILHQPDMRASERTFQLIAQVAGRTGRSLRGGRVLVQTSCPAEPAITRAAAHDYIGFATQELALRRELRVPPFVRLARVILRGPEENGVREYAMAAAELLRSTNTSLGTGVRILGPAPCPIARLKKHFRYHIQLSAEAVESLQQLWKAVVERLPQIPGLEFAVDVDPINLR